GAENGTNFWQEDIGVLDSYQWDSNPDLLTPPISTPPDSSFGRSAFAGSGTPPIINGSTTPITSAHQTFQLPDDAWNPLNVHRVLYNISAFFFWLPNSNDYSTLLFSFLDANGKEIDPAQNLLLPNATGRHNPPNTTLPGRHYFFYEHNGDVCPTGTKYLRVTMNFYATAGQSSSTAYIDNIYVAFQFKQYVPAKISIENKDNSVFSVTGWIAVGVGGLGVVLLLICVPLCTCFKKQGQPILKKFSLKRRNTSVRNSVRRKMSAVRRNQLARQYNVQEEPAVFEVGASNDNILESNTAYNARMANADNYARLNNLEQQNQQKY
ncbi:hypothetical protein HDU92_000955, partial [Lobulomyces angularis]